ncbi:MAG: DUF1919 domain-containing protein [Alistipes sp.]
MLYRKRIMRRLRKMPTPSIFTNNCIGGVVAHDLRMPFHAPTVNLFFEPITDFVAYLAHLPYYMTCELEACKMAGYECPAGILRGNGADIPDIHICFLHYHTFDEAREKWVARTARIKLDRLCILFEVPQLTEEILARFERLPYINKQILTYEKEWNHPQVYTMRGLERFTSGRILDYRGLSGQRYLDEFDYVAFLNSCKFAD